MKRILYKIVILTLILSNILTELSAQACVEGKEMNASAPKRDVRGVFLTTVFNINWPLSRTASPASQRSDLRNILDRLAANNYNTIYFQVRTECDALYKSDIEPWSYYLTGTQGQAPSDGWDPLEFIIEEAHARGLDLHAWLNPYRTRTNSGLYAVAPNHVSVTNPSWVFFPTNSTSVQIMNPGLPQVRDRITKVVMDISSRYDVDGIHFDDYFYPSSGMSTTSPQDGATYANHNPKNINNIGDWRRDNVNQMVADVYNAIQVINKAQNKNIIFGISPFGIWKSGTPAGITGNSAFNAMYCDPIAWMEAKTVDYIAPQCYWKIVGPQDYISLTRWWNDQVKARGSQLYVSQGLYRLVDASSWLASEIQNQINHNRSPSMDVTYGQIGYSYTEIRNNTKGLNTSLNNSQFRHKSFVPSIPGKDNVCPNPPVNVNVDGTKITWDTPSRASDGDLPRKYVVYAFDNPADAMANKDNGSKIIDITSSNSIFYDPFQYSGKYFVVSSLDKNSNESGRFDQSVDVKEVDLLAANQVTVHPNPFNDRLTIQFTTEVRGDLNIALFSLTGQKVWEEIQTNFNGKTLEINPSSINQGTYIGRVSSGKSQGVTFKVVKN